MKKIAVFFANGFEEAEALVPVDMFVRTGEIELIKVIVDDIDDSPKKIADGIYEVEGSRGVNISLKSSGNIVSLKNSLDVIKKADALFFPGGLRCAKNLSSSPIVSSLVKEFYSANKMLCAICASPAAVLAKNGAINSKNKGVCYPGCEDMSQKSDAKDILSLTFADKNGVCTSGNVISARGAGVAFEFAFAVIRALCGESVSKKVSSEVLY